MRVQNQSNCQGRTNQVSVVQCISAGIISAGKLHTTTIHDGACQAKTDSFTDLIQPIAGLVEWQVTLERNDCTKAAEEDRNVALHHLQRYALDSLAAFDSHSYHEKAEHTDQRG